MAHANDLPCDGDGICMTCKRKPSAEDEETITCRTCATPWHVTCFSDSVARLETVADAQRWVCPDCSTLEVSRGLERKNPGGLVEAVRAIESDESLNELEKAKRRQELVSGSGGGDRSDANRDKNRIDGGGGDDVIAILGSALSCSFCMQLPERPVTTPCGHNFCLKCFQKWIEKGKRTCANCRNVIPPKMASQPRINSALVFAIRMAKNAVDITERKGSPSWDYDEEKARRMWKKPPPRSRKQAESRNSQHRKTTRKAKHGAQTMSVKQKLLKELGCLICGKVMTSPLTTPCAHNFCKACLEGAFSGQSFIRERTCEGRRTLRSHKTVMKCPSCSSDIADFLQSPQVNRELMVVIESLQHESVGTEENSNESDEETESTHQKTEATADDNEPCNFINNQILLDNILKPRTVSKLLLTYKRKKARESISTAGDNISKPQTASKLQLTYKRRKKERESMSTADDNILKAQTVSKLLLTYKRKQARESISTAKQAQTVSKLLLTYRRKQGRESISTAKQPDAFNGETELIIPVKPEMADDDNNKWRNNLVDSKWQKTYKRRKSKDDGNLPMPTAGVMTRSKRIASAE